MTLADSRRLVTTLEDLKRLVHRYEYAYMSDPEAVALSVEQHRAIAAAFRTAEIDRAADLLERNWRYRMDRFLGHLRRRAGAGAA